MTFKKWWDKQRLTSKTNPREVGAKCAWYYQQKQIKKIKKYALDRWVSKEMWEEMERDIYE